MMHTKDTLQSLQEVLNHYLEGGEIEYSPIITPKGFIPEVREWHPLVKLDSTTAGCIQFDPVNKLYRIAPKKYTFHCVLLKCDGNFGVSCFESMDSLRSFVDNRELKINYKIIAYKKVEFSSKEGLDILKSSTK